MSEKYAVPYTLARYVISTYIKVLLVTLVAFAVLFSVLYFTGLYAQVENALNLKYYSPFVLVPLYSSIVLAFLCLFVGFLLFFHKYKRAKSGGLFYRTFSNILIQEQEKRISDVVKYNGG